MMFFRTIVASALTLATLTNALSIRHGHGHGGEHDAAVARHNQPRNLTIPRDSGVSDLEERGGGKVCIVYTGQSKPLLQALKTSKTHYFYNWKPDVSDVVKQVGFMACSTIWGLKSIQQFRQVRGNYQCIIGFNECNLGSQANLSPTDAARIWNQEVGWLAKKGVVLVGPSVTTAPNGFQWMIDFFNACGNANGPHCGVSMINLHFYGTNVQDFITYMTKFYNKFHLPIMVTEFACTDFSGRVHPSPAQVRAFMAGVISWMESTSWITGYCAFGITDGSLWGVSENARMLSGPSTLNSLGRAYVEGTWV